MADLIVKIKDSSNKDIFSETDAGIIEFLVSYAVNRFPTASLTLSSKSFDELLKYKDLIVGVSLYDGAVNKSHEFFVSKATVTDEFAVLTGKLTKSINDTYKITRYLGKDTKSAIEALGFYQEYTSDINLTHGFYQFNETAVSALDNILRLSSFGKLYCITNGSIYFADPYDNSTPVRNLSNLVRFDMNNIMHLIPLRLSNNSTGIYSRKASAFTSSYDGKSLAWSNEVDKDGYYKSSEKFHSNINYNQLVSYYPGQIHPDLVKNSLMENKFIYDLGITVGTQLDNYDELHLGDKVSSILHYGNKDIQFDGFMITAINESYSNKINVGVRVGCYFNELIKYIDSDIPYYKEELL